MKKTEVQTIKMDVMVDITCDSCGKSCKTECGFEYLGSCSKAIKGLYFMNGKIRDDKIKGDLDLEYEFVN